MLLVGKHQWSSLGTTNALPWEPPMVFLSNHQWSSLGTTNDPPWEPPAVFLGSHLWFSLGTTNGPCQPPVVIPGNHQWLSMGVTNGPPRERGLPWERPTIFLGNNQVSSLGTTDDWWKKILVGIQYKYISGGHLLQRISFQPFEIVTHPGHMSLFVWLSMCHTTPRRKAKQQ